ncbi:MAG TPA: hypothetical protein VNQ90_19505 [Chthoniobacteraceae bacterium]|nr:hypothetical protein [Chthoniobacteraceae bacterium]
MKRSASTLRSGFNLLSLLLVIAVVGILLAILLPALQSTQKMRENTICVHNLRQLHAGVMLYAADHNGTLPQSYSSGRVWYNQLADGDGPVGSNRGPLPNANYIPNHPRTLTVYNCPANPYRTGHWNGASYAYNVRLGFIDPADPVGSYTIKVTSLDQPGRVVMLSDAGIRKALSQSPTLGPPVIVRYSSKDTFDPTFIDAHVAFDLHAGSRANFLLADGHVEALTSAEAKRRFKENTLLWSRDNAHRNPPW